MARKPRAAEISCWARKARKYVNEKRLVDMALEYVDANPAIFPETAVALAEPKSS